MNAHDRGPIENTNNLADHHAGDTGVLPETDYVGDDVQAARFLAELLGEPEPILLPNDVQWFTATLLQHPRQAVQTAPVIAMVAELLDILRDEHVSDQKAHQALRRAVQWLQIFTAEPPGATNRHHPTTDGRNYTVSATDLVAAAASWQLATTWLRGTPQAAIRTEPVIGVVAQLHYYLQRSSRGQHAQAQLRHAVQLLEVFVADEEAAPQPQ